MSESLSTAIERFQQGQLAEAQRLLDALQAAGVDDSELWHYQGLIAYSRREFGSAQRNLLKAIERSPSDARLPNHLGLVRLDAGHVAEAIQFFRDAITLNPQYALPHFHLGLSFQSIDQPEQAIDSYQTALRLNPNHLESWNNQGVMHHSLRRLDAAADCFAQALQRKPDYVAAISNLGLVRHDQQRFEEAVRLFEQGLRISVGNACLANNLGRALLALDRPREALACFDRAIGEQPQYADAWHNRGLALESIGQVDDAGSAFRKALDLDADRPDSIASLGTVALQRGRIQDAIESFQQATRLDPGCTEAWYHLSEMQPDEFTDADVLRLRKIACNTRIGESVRASAEFALGNVHQHRRQFEQAFEHFAAGNMLRKPAFDPQTHAEFIDSVINVFSADLIRWKSKDGDSSANVVFIVGMPRSGTTLVEQIIARHSRVRSGGELSLISQLAMSLSAPSDPQMNFAWLDQIAGLDATKIEHLSASFLEAFPPDARSKMRLVDKTPANFIYLGLIAMLFPQARVIHCRRHPLDTALSCYFRNFEHVPFSFDLEHIASYYQQYARLMQHWAKVLPLEICTIDYEQIVAQPEHACRAILGAAGLDWKPDCLAFHEGSGTVQTASAWQVRQPIHGRSVKRWHHYRPWIESLMRELGIADN